MPENKFTTGPWTIHDETYCPEEIWGNLDLIDGHVRGTHICTVDQENPQWRENAKLIASAPKMKTELDRLSTINSELLAALKGARHALGIAQDDAINASGPKEAKFFGPYLQAAADAIANAMRKP